MNRRRFLKYAGATAAVAGASALGFDYVLEPRLGNPNLASTTSSSASVPLTVGNLQWEPTKAVNDKIYDGAVSFTVNASSTNTIDAKLDFAPQYPTEIPRRAIPEENTRSYNLSGTGTNHAFNQSITDLKGGKRYQITASVSDTQGNQKSSELVVPYMRELENITRNLKVTASALYYPAYTSGARTWEGTIGTPLLGQYDSSDEFVIDRHIDWASGYGIGTFFPNFTGPDFPSTRIMRDVYLESPVADNMKFAFNYESHLRLKQVPYKTWWHIDVDDPSNLVTIKSDFNFLAKNFFDNPNYLHIDDRPVVAFDRTRFFVGDLPSFWGELRKHMRSLGHDPYLIGDEVYWHYDWTASPTSDSTVQRIKSYDAIICYNAYSPGEDYLLAGFENNVDQLFAEWSRVAWANGVGFIPSALPGIDLRQAPWGGPFTPLERSVERFRKELDICLKHTDPNLKTFFIFFNEWNENSGVEPSVQDGFEYLQTLHDTLAGH